MPCARTRGVVLGTFAYMSPEQAEGNPVDGRSDIFSFGCLLHEMLTGQRPFGGSSPASIVSAILRDEPPEPGALRPDIPNELPKIFTQKRIKQNIPTTLAILSDVVKGDSRGHEAAWHRYRRGIDRRQVSPARSQGGAVYLIGSAARRSTRGINHSLQWRRSCGRRPLSTNNLSTSLLHEARFSIIQGTFCSAPRFRFWRNAPFWPSGHRMFRRSPPNPALRGPAGLRATVTSTRS